MDMAKVCGELGLLAEAADATSPTPTRLQRCTPRWCRLPKISPEMNCLSEFQLAAGKEVLLAFEKDTNPWHLLFAQPQSGKTDTFYFIAAEMLRLNKVDNISKL